MNAEQRDAIARKLRALQALAQDAGASEAEAINAAAKARELMDKYNIDLTEAEIRKDPLITEIRWSEGRYDDYAKVGIPAAVQKYTDTKMWNNKNGALVILGSKPDVEFAKWLLDTLMGFVARGAAEYRGTQTEKRNFAITAASRITKRIMDEVEARKRANDSVKNQALVLVTKKAMIDQWLLEQGMHFSKGSHRSYSHNEDGARHGDSARWDRPISPTGEQQRRLK
jgi:hypothetical protein